jgi:hypothetical protein
VTPVVAGAEGVAELIPQAQQLAKGQHVGVESSLPAADQTPDSRRDSHDRAIAEHVGGRVKHAARVLDRRGL